MKTRIHFINSFELIIFNPNKPFRAPRIGVDKNLESLANQLSKCTFKVTGKSTFKEEFVTAGGIDLKEINFKRFESKLHKNLFFAGEVLNIDAVTGGFNFQNAWTGGWIVANAVGNKSTK